MKKVKVCTNHILSLQYRMKCVLTEAGFNPSWDDISMMLNNLLEYDIKADKLIRLDNEELRNFLINCCIEVI